MDSSNGRRCIVYLSGVASFSRRHAAKSTMVNGRDSLLEVPRGAPGEVTDKRVAGFDVFLREQYAGLLHFLRRRVRNEEDAKDAAQESMMRLMRYRDAQPESAWKPLLYRIAINVVGEQFRRGNVRRITCHVSLEDVELRSTDPAQEELVARSQQRALLRDAVLELPDRCRQVYLLSRMREMTYAEIARHCGISVKTVEKHMTRALALLCETVGSGGENAS